MDENGRITSRPNGGVQRVRAGRKLFGRKRRAVFLEHLAATCNVAASAEAAGVTASCAYQRRMKDAEFRAEWRRALEQGYARLETELLAEALGEGGSTGPHPARADARVDPLPRARERGVDKDLALHLLREHKKGLAGIDRGGAAEKRNADWSEVEDYFIGKLKALRKRLENGRQ